jgi:[acyl-carrier-protein] S-malonyltransferase
MTFAMVFPGQGSQSVGMLARLLAEHPAAATAFAEADEALGYGLGALVRDGPAELLNRTDHTQPAMLAAGVAAWRAWQARGGPWPVAMAGHSLGEYTALVCAGAEADGGVVEAVNFNAPGQVVIAGDAAAVARAIELSKAAGARRAMALPVSVPSHCRLMDPVGEKLAQALAGAALCAPQVPVYHNVDAAVRGDSAAIRAALAYQVRRPVRWVECVRAIQSAGVQVLVEAGPGRVLCGLAKRIDRDLAALPADDPDTLGAALAAVTGDGA